MGNKLTPKIILESTRLTFKTEIAFELNEHPRVVGQHKYRYHSPLISAEWCTFTNHPRGRGPINFEPQEESLAMESRLPSLTLDISDNHIAAAVGHIADWLEVTGGLYISDEM